MILVVVGSVQQGFAGKDETKITIDAGPVVISAAEKAIVGDADSGTTDGVILIEETDRNEGFRTKNRVTYHLRAKILSADGRGLADVTIPFNRESSKLKRWWGRTILPDGTVIALDEDELEEQLLAKSSWLEYTVLKGTLPGVEPGCVIDLGYEVEVEGSIPLLPVPLQRDWPLREFRYRWVPWQGRSAAFYITREDKVDVNVTRTDEAVLVKATNTSPVVNEPYSPPNSAIRSVMYLYYTNATGNFEHYWRDKAKNFEKMVDRFAGSKGSRRKLLAAMELDPGGDVDAKLRSLYEWIAENMENTSLRTYEEHKEAEEADEDEKPDTVKEAIKLRKGTNADLDMLFVALARTLGATARLVLVPNRTEAFFLPQVYDTGQFDGIVVAIGDSDDSLSFVAPGSGLPFGVVPWWLSGVPGAMPDEEGMLQVLVNSSAAEQSVSTTQVEMSFDEIDGLMLANWTRTGTGHAGFSEKRLLRSREPEKREEQLRKLCGENPDMEVIEASAPGLTDTGQGFRLQCSGESFAVGMEDGADTFRVGIAGPWIEKLPGLTDESRTHPVILPYTRVDTTLYTIIAPEGFKSGEPPSQARIDSPVGAYTLQVTKQPDGYLVTRSLSLKVLGLEVKDYPILLAYLNAVRIADQAELEFVRVVGS